MKFTLMSLVQLYGSTVVSISRDSAIVSMPYEYPSISRAMKGNVMYFRVLCTIWNCLYRVPL
jgi:hypothetical protein